MIIYDNKKPWKDQVKVGDHVLLVHTGHYSSHSCATTASANVCGNFADKYREISEMQEYEDFPRLRFKGFKPYTGSSLHGKDTWFWVGNIPGHELRIKTKEEISQEDKLMAEEIKTFEYHFVQVWNPNDKKNRLIFSNGTDSKIIYSTNATGAPVDPATVIENRGLISRSKDSAYYEKYYIEREFTHVVQRNVSLRSTIDLFSEQAVGAFAEKTTEEKPKLEIAINQDNKEFIPEKEYFLDTGILEPIKAGVVLNKPVLLIGETGVGKTAVIRHLAAESRNGFRRLNLNGSTTSDEFVGRWKLSKDKEMVWIDGVLVEAMKKGLWLLCDEINACLPEISFVLHSVLDDDRMVVLSNKDNEVVKPHKDFRFFASMNPNYAGTHSLNLALEDRFSIVVAVDYPSQVQEVKIVEAKSEFKDKDIIKKMVQVANKLRQEYKQERTSTPFSTRKLIDWAILTKTFGLAQAYKYVVINKMAVAEQVVASDIAATIFVGDEFKKELSL